MTWTWEPDSGWTEGVAYGGHFWDPFYSKAEVLDSLFIKFQEVAECGVCPKAALRPQQENSVSIHFVGEEIVFTGFTCQNLLDHNLVTKPGL